MVVDLHKKPQPEHDNGLPRALSSLQIARMHVLPRLPRAPCLHFMLRSNRACDLSACVISMGTSIAYSSCYKPFICASSRTQTISESLQLFSNPPLHDTCALLISQTALSAVNTCRV